MCMIDDAERVTMLAASYSTARVQHKCRECFRLIEPGERYHSDRYLFEGKFTNHKTCAHCMVARGWLSDECGGWLFGGVEEDLRGHAQDGYYGFDVKRVAVGMARKWRRRDGSLMPIPAQPLTSEERRARAAGVPA